MGLIESLTGTKLQIDPSHRAARVSLRPHEFKADGGDHLGGNFSIAVSTGLTTGLAADDAIFSLRWANADRRLLLIQARVFAALTTAFGTAQDLGLDLIRVRNMTSKDTGGTDLSGFGDGLRKSNATMGISGLNDLRISTTGALTKASGTEDSYPLNAVIFAGLTNTLGLAAEAKLYEMLPGVEHPITIANNEGLRIRNRIAQGATGVVRYTVHLDWIELPLSQLT